MPIAKESGGNFTPVPEGTHLARCVGVISLGTQHSQMFADSFKVMFMWEVPSERIQIDGKDIPMIIQKEYTLSLSKKANLRRDLESWRGKQFTEDELKGFEVSKVIGQPCLLSIMHKDKANGTGKYAAITAVSKPAKGMTCDPQVHESVVYEVETGRSEIFKSLPEWIRKKIEVCEEWQSPKVEEEPALPPSEEPDDSDVPF